MATATLHTADDMGIDDDGTRFEVIGGNLYMSTAPHLVHQATCVNITRLLANWN